MLKNIYIRKKSTTPPPPSEFSWYVSAVGGNKVYFHLFNTAFSQLQQVPKSELLQKFINVILSMTGTYLRTFSRRSPVRIPGNSHRSSSAPPPGHIADYSYHCPVRTGE